MKRLQRISGFLLLGAVAYAGTGCGKSPGGGSTAETSSESEGESKGDKASSSTDETATDSMMGSSQADSSSGDETGSGSASETGSGSQGSSASDASGSGSTSDDTSSTSEDTEGSSDGTQEDSSGETEVDPDSPFGINGKLHICEGKLCNQYGNPIQLRGMSSHGLQWFENCMKPSAFQTLRKDWGADVVRLSTYIQEGGYETNPEYFRNLIDRLIEQCTDEGLYCIMDWHQHEPGDPNFNLDLALEFFEIMAKKHADKANVIYEICNEPSEVAWADIKSYAEKVIPVVREHAPDSVVIVGTPTWASEPNAAIGDELDFANIMYTMHFYADEHGEDYRSNVIEAAEAGLAVFATEFGTQWSSGDGDNNFEAAEVWLDLLAQYKISWTNWNFSDDKRSGAVWKRIRDAEDETDPDKTGDVCKKELWTDDNLKEAGVWIKDKISNPADDFPTD